MDQPTPQTPTDVQPGGEQPAGAASDGAVRRIVIGGPAVPPPTPVATLAQVASFQAAPARRRKRRVLALVAGCATLVGAGGIAAFTVVGGGSGGAGSPEEAVEQLVAAVNDADVVGVLDSLLPSERRVWGEPLLALFDEAERLEVLAPSADPADLSGIDLRLDIEIGEVDEVAADIAIVPVTGRSSGSVDLTALPIGSLLTDQGVDVVDTADPTVGDDIDGRLATVERDGRWYVSIWYSVAEDARRNHDDLFWPARESAILAEGADNPEQAVLGMLAAIESRSVEGIVSRLDPEEAEVLQRVGPWYVADAQAQLDTALTGAGTSFTWLDTDLAVIEQTADRAVVDIGGVGFELEVQGTRVRYRDGCTSTTPPRGQEVTQCFGEQLAPGATLREQLAEVGLGGLSDSVAELTSGVAAAVAEISGHGLVVRAVDGEWFVSPVASGFELILDVVRALDRVELDGIVDDAQLTFAEFESLFVLGAADEETSAVDTTGGDGSTDAGQPVDRYYACAGRTTYDAALQCVQAGLAAGDFPREIVDGIYLVPECGWVGARFDASLFALPDSEYVARATLSAACFDQKIFTGVIAENQRPLELFRVECLDGRNPATMTASQSLAYTTCRRGG